MLAFFLTSSDSHLRTIILMVIVLASLAIAQIVGYVLRRHPDTTWNPAVIGAFNHRLRAYWMMCAILTVAFLVPWAEATVLLFFFVSFWALREFITLTPTRMGDHRALFWVFFIFTPLQYIFVAKLPDNLGLGGHYPSYGLFVIAVPVFGFLFIFTRIALAGDSKRFLERAAKTQAALLICVYSLSYAPALLCLDLRESSGDPTAADPAGLLFFFVVIVQVGDIFQYAWGRFIGKHVIAPEIHANRTWEGFIGGVISTALLGTILSWATPFNEVQAALMSTVIAILGFAGTMTLSAIK